jgi:hypothetical protein
MVTIDQIKDSEPNSSAGPSLHAPLSLGSYFFSAFFPAVNTIVASLAIYSHHEVLYWLVSPSLLLIVVFVVARALYLQKESLRTRELILVQPDAKARDACESLAKSSAINFAFGMYGIAAAMALLSWVVFSHK